MSGTFYRHCFIPVFAPICCIQSKMADDIGRYFRMRLALRVIRIQYRNSVRCLVFSPYNKFCNPLGYVTFWVAISSNLPTPSFVRDPTLSQANLSTRPSSFNHVNAPSAHPRFSSSSFHTALGSPPSSSSFDKLLILCPATSLVLAIYFPWNRFTIFYSRSIVELV